MQTDIKYIKENLDDQKTMLKEHIHDETEESREFRTLFMETIETMDTKFANRFAKQDEEFRETFVTKEEYRPYKIVAQWLLGIAGVILTGIIVTGLIHIFPSIKLPNF